MASACGNGTLATSDDPASALVATCGSVVFPTLSADPPTFPPLDQEAQAAFEEFVTGPLSVESGQLAAAELTIASRSGDEMTLFGQQPGEDGFVNVEFQRRDGEWRATSWGGCSVIVSADGFGSASTRFDPDIGPDPASATLNLVIQERECASGLAPTDRAVVPVVVETETRIEIITMVEPIRGHAECPSNPWFPVTATLDAPLGDRVVVDAQMPPGTELSWPPNLEN